MLDGIGVAKELQGYAFVNICGLHYTSQDIVQITVGTLENFFFGIVDRYVGMKYACKYRW